MKHSRLKGLLTSLSYFLLGMYLVITLPYIDRYYTVFYTEHPVMTYIGYWLLGAVTVYIVFYLMVDLTVSDMEKNVPDVSLTLSVSRYSRLRKTRPHLFKKGNK